MDDATSDERWLPIPGFSNYQVSDHGRVWSSHRGGKVLKPFPARDGYPQVRIMSDAGDHVNLKLHRLVLTVFRGPCPMGMEACHGPGGYLDARLSNLRWATRADNNRDRLAEGVAFLKFGSPTGKTCVELSSDRRRAFREQLSDQSG